jgi:hypothetical protein
LEDVTATRQRDVASQASRHAYENQLAYAYIAEQKPAFYRADDRTLEGRALGKEGEAEGREREPQRRI